MPWPKKGTRKIIVDGVEYLWHYSAHCPMCSDDVFTVGIQGNPYVLFIDPFPYNFELKPSCVANAIRWATNNGWTPNKGPTRAMSMDSDSNFIWLSEGERHLRCQNQSGLSDMV
jgi:hypothetical protein